MPAPVSSPKLYTPTQIRAGSFLGGPVASMVLLRENFRVLGNASAAKTTLWWGMGFIISLWVILYAWAALPSFPLRLPLVIPLAYSIAAGAIADRWQLRKPAIVESGQYQIQSSWQVVGTALLSILAFVMVGLVMYLILVALGLKARGIGLE